MALESSSHFVPHFRADPFLPRNERQSKLNTIEITWHSTDNTEVTIAYSGSTVVVGFKQAEGILILNMPASFAMHLLLELREALKDLHTEPGEIE